MPHPKSPPDIASVDIETAPLKLVRDQLENGFALELVNRTFSNWENFRTLNHDSRWRTADSLFFGWVPQRNWEGTTIPRASLSRPIVFEQVETIVPVIYNAIFSSPDWFQVEPELGGSVHQARQIQDVMMTFLESPKEDSMLNFRAEMELAIRDLALYGNGGVFLEWDAEHKRPKVSWANIKDLYFDPGAGSPSVDECRGVIHRKMMTVAELAALRDTDERLNIPENDVLYFLAENTPYTQGDQSKAVQEAIRGVSYTPGATDRPVNPADRRVEVLVYYTKERVIWVLSRRFVAYNEPNPYGFIPFCFAPCFPVSGRFYGRSIAEIQHWNQRYIEALLNARLDELTLALQPPRVQPRDSVMTPAQTKWRPGAVFTSANPGDMKLLQPQSLMNNVYTEIQYIEQAVEKATGINALTQGVPRSGNIHRTSAGIGALQGAAVSRVGQIVSGIENYLIIPMLHKLFRMIQFHIKSWDNITARDQKTGTAYQVSGLAFRNRMSFRMLASSRVLTRDKLASVFPFLSQYLLNGALLGQLQQTGKTIDIDEFFRMLQDATGVASKYQLIRPMSQQEQQALQQQQQQAMAAQMQGKMTELQTRQQIAAQKNQTALQIAAINNQPDPGAAERERQKVQAQMLLARIKTQAAAEEARLKMAARMQENEAKRQMNQIRMQELLQNLRFSAAERQQKMAAKAFEAAISPARFRTQQGRKPASQPVDDQFALGKNTAE